jgi:hypothetical protein
MRPIRILIVCIGVVLALTACDGGGNEGGGDGGGGDGGNGGNGAEEKNLTGTFIRWEPVDDARGYAYFSVTNHGSTEALAECTIKVSNDFGNFGFDYLVGEPVGPGETINGRVALDVGEGSFLINEGEVTNC